MAKAREDVGDTSATGEPRKRGRPAGSGDRVSKPYQPTGRPRGRPRTATPKVPSGRPRGRPKGSVKKSDDRKAPAKAKTTTSTGPERRGRPRKDASGGRAEASAAGAPGGAKKRRGRPSKAAPEETVGFAEEDVVDDEGQIGGDILTDDVEDAEGEVEHEDPDSNSE